MPGRYARTGSEKASGENNNTRNRFDGATVLSSKNEWDNPDLTEFDAEGEPFGWQLLAPPDYIGYNFYGKGPDFPRYTRQNYGVLAFSRSSWDLVQMVEGDPMPDQNHIAPVAAPLPPEVELVNLDRQGLVAGFYGASLFNVVGDPKNPSRRRLTKDGPVATFQASQGQGALVGLPNTVDEHVTGLGVAVTRPQASAAAALTAPRYIQTIVDTRRGIPDLAPPINGPLITRDVVPSTNQTYVGPPELYGLSWHIGYSPYDCDAFITRISFAFRTPRGWSASQRQYDVDTKTGYWNGAVHIRPQSLPWDAVEWRLEYIDSNDSWQAIEGMKPGTTLRLHTIEVTDLNTTNATPASGSRRVKPEDDETGIADMDEAPDTVGAFGVAAPTPGPYSWRATLATEGELESAPSSPPVNMTLPMGKTFRLRKPEVGNFLPNPEFVERDPDANENERDWERISGTGVTHDITRTGEIRMSDRTLKATDEEVRRSNRKAVNPNRAVTARFKLRLSNYTGGVFRCILRQHISGGTTQDTIVGEFFGNTPASGKKRRREREVEVTVGPAPKREAPIKYAVGVTHVQLIFIHMGSTEKGTRSFDIDLNFSSLFGGDVAARKRRKPDPRGPQDDEKVEEAYPPDAYCEVVRNPEDGATSEVVYSDASFSGGTIPTGWTVVKSDASTMVAVDNASGIYDQWGLHVRDTTTTTLNRSFIHFPIPPVNPARQSVAVILWIDDLPGTADADVLAIGHDVNTLIGRMRLTTDGRLKLATVETVANREMVLARGLKEGDVLFIELRAEGGGTAGGVLTAQVGRHGSEVGEEAQFTGANWTGRFAKHAFLGVTDESLASNTIDVRYDWALVSDFGIGNGDPIPGNMIEYYAPDRTPISEGFGPTGFKSPVKGGLTYTWSVYAWWKGVNIPASSLRLVAKDSAGRVVGIMGTYLRNVRTRSRYWKRPSITNTVPANAAYVEVVGGPVADGLFRFMGFQQERGGVMTAFSNQHAPAGSVVVTFDLNLPGVPWDAPIEAHGLIKRYLAAGAKGNLPPGTNIAADFRSSDFPPDSVAPLPNWSIWTTDLDAVPLRKFFQVRASLTTTDLTASPILRDLFLEFERPQPTFSMADGTEFPGGAVPFDVPPVSEEENITVLDYADNTQGFRVDGIPRQRLDGWSLETYLWDTAELIMKLQGKKRDPNPNNASAFRIETDGRQITARVFNIKFGPSLEGRKFPIAGMEDEGVYQFIADSIEGYVLNVKKF